MIYYINKGYPLLALLVEPLIIVREMIHMKVVNKNSDFVSVEFTAEEYEAFVQILKLQRKDYKGGAK